MNPAEKAAYKAKVKKLIVDHITTVCGYPNCTNEQIMQELKPLYVKIEEADLKLPGLTYAHFVAIAGDQYAFCQIKKAMGGS